MASASDTDDTDGADDGFQAVSQDQYEQETRELRDIDLAVGQMRVQESKPLEVVKAAQNFGVESLLNRGQEMNIEEMLGDDGDGGLTAFMERFVIPKIVRPTCYWTMPDPSDPVDPDAAFDLSVLEDDDTGKVISAVMGQDVDPDDADDPTESGNGTTSGEMT